MKEPQCSSSLIATGISFAAPKAPGSQRGPRSGTLKYAARSRATPKCPQQSARLRVRSNSRTTSCSIPKASKTPTPSGVVAGKMTMPSDSSASPSSLSEHNMPSESIPKIPRRAISIPLGIVVPNVANATMSPSFMFVAPHHTWRNSPSPASTKHRVTLAASGCFSVRTILAVMTPSTGLPTTCICSTGRPSELSAVAT
ncbi:unannotated protein [freshwater metagenome]|uniref:Unannotated protein n=1 Tax=freshwater metagenome TaxID=449393 RepID=A0A6J6EGJ9_9ZZZZ